MKRCALAVAVVVIGSGCPRPGVQSLEWRDFWRLRQVGNRLAPGRDSGSLAQRYLSINGSAYFVRLPGIRPGSQAMVRVRVSGVFPEPERLVAVAGPATVGADGSFRFEGFPSLGIFPLRGQPLTLDFAVRTVPESEALNLAGRMAGARSILGRFDPRNRSHVSMARGLATSMFDFARSPLFKFRLTLPVHLGAGTHVLIARPPPGSPSALRQRLALSALTRSLRFRNKLLLWRDEDRELAEAPYLLLRVTSHRRHPRGRHPEIVKGHRGIDRLLVQGKHAKALEAADQLERTIGNARAILKREQSLEVRRLDLRRAQIRADKAAQVRNLEVRDRFRRRELAILRQALLGFKGFLTTRERDVFVARAERLGAVLKGR